MHHFSSRLVVLSVLYVLVVAVSYCQGDGVWPPKNQGEDISERLGLGANAPLRVAALGDWNNDGSVDLLGAAMDNHTFVIYSYHPDNHTFVPRHFISVIEHPTRSNVSNGTANESIVTVVVGDLNRDGRLDAIVTTSHDKVHLIQGGGSNPTVVRNFLWGSDHIVNAASLNVLDIFGGCAAVDITVQTDSGLAIYRNDFNVNDQSCEADAGNQAKDFNFTKVTTIPMSTGYSASVDVNGDCSTDLIIGQIDPDDGHRVVYSIYTENLPVGGGTALEEAFATPDHTFSVPPIFSTTPAIGDFNGDGGFDFVFTTCSSPSNISCEGSPMDSLVFLLNGVSEMCGGEANDCCAVHDFGFDNVLNQNDLDGNFNYKNLNETCSRSSLALQEPILRSLDWNNDALSDVVVATHIGPMLLLMQGGMNIECSNIHLSSSPLAVLQEEEDELSQIVRPFFFDFLDDGRVDIMTTSSAGYGVHAVWNALDTSEHFFFTATVLNGVTKGQCESQSEYCWGGYQIGGTHRFQWSDMESNVKTASATQISTSQYGSLQFPRQHFGLDKTFGYIFNYAIGMRLQGLKTPFSLFPAYLVPNSQVMCDGHPLLDPSKWKIVLFFQGIRYMLLIIVSLIISLVVIGIPILVLKYREHKEDQKEKGYYAR